MNYRLNQKNRLSGLRNSKAHRWAAGLTLLCLWVLADTACTPLVKSGNDELFEVFNLIPASEHVLLDAAYRSLQELYPYGLIFPLPGPRLGLTTDVYGPIEFPLYPHYSRHGLFSRLHIEIWFNQSLGKTLAGDSIISGYRYAILAYPNSADSPILDQTDFHELDLLFRSELYRHRIEVVEVTKVI